MNITPFDQLEQEAEDVQGFLDCEIQSDNVEEIKERGDALSSYISRTGNMLAEAQVHLRELMKDEAFEIIEQIVAANKLSAGVQNALIKSSCNRHQFLVDKIEQLNKTAKYQIDWCRSRLSMAKEELNNSRGWQK